MPARKTKSPTKDNAAARTQARAQAGEVRVAAEPKHIYRYPDAVIGGVCAGVAERFDLDAALVRLIAILLSVVTAGAFVIVYLAAWLVLPAKPKLDDTVDIDPSSFKSEVYEQVVSKPHVQTAASSPGRAAGASAAYLPPRPPQAASGYYAYEASASAGTGTPFRTGPASAASPADDAKGADSSNRVLFGLVVGCLFIALGAAALFSSLSGRFAIVQFWPLVLVVLGIVRVVLPAKDGTRTVTTWIGALAIFIGLVALASSLGLYRVDVGSLVTRAVPFLVIAVGLFVMGRASHNDVLIVLAGIAVTVFLCAGMYFSLSEASDHRSVSVPFVPDSVFEWRWR